MTATAKKQSTPGLSTHEVMRRLRKHYSGTGYAVLQEVADGTGSHHSRWADALTMSLWPSRGLELMGFEVKVSRSDWIKERDDPSKADAVCKYCDRWYVVAGDASIVREGELPKTWGLIVPDGDGLKIAKQAPELSPVTLDRPFVAAIMRRCAEQSLDAKALKAIEDAAYDRGVKVATESVKTSLKRDDSVQQAVIDKLTNRIKEFQDRTGLSLDRYWNDFDDVKEIIRRHDAGIQAEKRMVALRAVASEVLRITEPHVEAAEQGVRE